MTGCRLRDGEVKVSDPHKSIDTLKHGAKMRDKAVDKKIRI